MTKRIASTLALAAALLAACGPTTRTATRRPATESGPPTTLAAAAWTPQSSATEIGRWAREGCRRAREGRQPCIERALVSLIDPAGIGKAMEVLDTLVTADPDVRANAHALAHGLGIAAYRSPETVAKTFADCPPTLMSGCYHGVVQGYFLALQREGKEVGKAELDALCTPHKAVSFLYFQCAHGVGHGLMAVHENHVPMSLQACDQATDDFVRESCYGGVFMENIVNFTHPHHTAAGHAGTQGHDAHGAQPKADDHAAHDSAGGAHQHGNEHAGHGAQAMRHEPFKALDPADPLYPCTVVDEKYRPSCYTMQTSAMLFFNRGDIAATARGCEKAPEAYLGACYASLGRDITAYASQRHDRSIQMCSTAAGLAGGRAQVWCLNGVVQNLINVAADAGEGIRFCRALSAAEHKRECYRVVGETITTLENAPAARASRCAPAEPEYVAFCRRGAGLQESAGMEE
ncbi:MAG TPA: hypothetical protein VFQ45_21605 [Longimicrobium sp.]|nr:hypothetical protein [Longimicrobium sp.]